MKKGLLRFFWSALRLAIAGAAAKYENDPRYLVIAPLLSGGMKLVREKLGTKYPFLGELGI